MKKLVVIGFAIMIGLSIASSASAAVLFTDNFTGSANAAWSNYRGNWISTGNVYDAQNPGNNPPTISLVSTLPSLTDFTAYLSIEEVCDGGVWLHTDATGMNGLMLVTGGNNKSYNGFYWHTISGGVFSSAMNYAPYAGLQGSDVQLKIVVSGDTYNVYVNGSSTATAAYVDTTDQFTSGHFGLYDFSGQTFDKVVITDSAPDAGPVPEPATLGAVLLGTLGMFLRKKK